MVGVASLKSNQDIRPIVDVLKKLKLRSGVSKDDVYEALMNGDIPAAEVHIYNCYYSVSILVYIIHLQMSVSRAPTISSAPSLLNRKTATLSLQTKGSSKGSVKKVSTSPVMSPRKVSSNTGGMGEREKFNLVNDIPPAQTSQPETARQPQHYCSTCNRAFESAFKLARHLDFSTLHTLNAAPPIPLVTQRTSPPSLPAPSISIVEYMLLEEKEMAFFVPGLGDLVSLHIAIYFLPTLRCYVVRGHANNDHSEV